MYLHNILCVSRICYTSSNCTVSKTQTLRPKRVHRAGVKHALGEKYVTAIFRDKHGAHHMSLKWPCLIAAGTFAPYRQTRVKICLKELKVLLARERQIAFKNFMSCCLTCQVQLAVHGHGCLYEEISKSPVIVRYQEKKAKVDLASGYSSSHC